MIVAEEHDQLLLITQNDHAALAADLLEVWRPLARHPRRRLLLEATRRHDNGWMEIDSAPPVDGDGRPHDFITLPPARRLEIWDRGTARYLRDRPEWALLITEHALALHRSAQGPGRSDPEIGELVELLRERRAELVERLEASGESREIVESYPWLALADLLSLVVCAGWRSPRELDHPHGGDRLSIELLGGGDAPLRLVLDPFPLAGATTLGVPVRRIPARAYGGTVELVDALLSVSYQRLAVRLEPPDSGSPGRRPL